MSDWTPAPWLLDPTYDIGDWCIGTRQTEIAQCDTDNPEWQANARRIVAAVNATKDFTIEGLEQIAAGGHETRLALLASLMLEEIKAKEKAEEEAETGEYPLSRGD